MTVLGPLGSNAYIAMIANADLGEVSSIAFVRSVTPLHPAFRVDKRLYSELTISSETMPERRYYALLRDAHISTFEAIQARVIAVGAEILQSAPSTRRIELRASAEELAELIKNPDILFVDFPGETGFDMDRVREISGANHDGVVGFRGEGVRGEVMDLGIWTAHPAFQQTPILHGLVTNATFPHGTSVFGILFSNGAGDLPCPPQGPCGLGLLPAGEGIFAQQTAFEEDPPTANRYIHTSQLVRSNDCASEPLCPLEAVFQTNSWGHNPRLEYTVISFEMDEIVFDLDILLCQSQTNCGRQGDTCENSPCAANPQCSRPQAWAKNVLSVGAFFDFPDTDHRNDLWCPAGPGTNPISCENPRCGSRGPSIDGRVKPDLVHFNDCIRTTKPGQMYNSSFGGTSAATPITCGYAGLVFQMWHEGVFKVWNGTTSVTTGGGQSVFADRPHAATVKAMLINTAYRYPLVTEPPNYRPDFTRDNMGWGIVDIAALYEQRETMFIVNETDVLTEFQTKSYTYNVPSGSPALRVTLVYTDPPGIPNSTHNLVNDLSLKVVSPSGAIYWGNFGLVNCGLDCSDNYMIPYVGNWSLVDSDTLTVEKDHKNNVENIFIKNPAAGNWTITIIADAINEDGHEETSSVDDADYALVISSAERPRGRCCQTNCTPYYQCDCSWTSKAECSGTNKFWSSEATCADACGTTCPNICIE